MSKEPARELTVPEMKKLVASKSGCARLIDISAHGDAPKDERREAGEVLLETMTPIVIDALCEHLPPSAWEALTGSVFKVTCAAAEALMRKDPARALRECEPLLTGDEFDEIVVEAIFAGVDGASRPPNTRRGAVKAKDQRAIDQAWAPHAWRFVDADDLDVATAALVVLLGVEPQPSWRERLEVLRSEHYEGPSLALANALIEKLSAAESAQAIAAEAAAAARKASGPLPPEKIGRAPKPTRPKYEPRALLRAKLDAALAKAGLTKHAGVLIEPAIDLLTRRVDESKLPLGATKLGGHPDLPVGTEWPHHRGVPLAFVAQIALADVAKLGEKRLPSMGLLSFFVDDDGEDYLQKAVVLHTKETKKLTRLEVPPTFQIARGGRPARQPFAACAVEMVPTLTVPSPTNPAVTKLGAKAAAYEEHVTLSHPEVSQLLGFRDHGYDAENPSTARLLLRVTSDAQAAMCWGDKDNLDFYVPQKDLARGSFAKVYPYVGD